MSGETLTKAQGSHARALDRGGGPLYNGRASAQGEAEAIAQVAQLVEHVTENHGVGGSIPPLGTKAIDQLLI